ncbi:MAG: DUF4105 domain-containing protein [Gammaproteobacteria bacterium]
MSRFFLVGLLLWFFALPCFAADNAYLHELVRQARAQHLAQQAEWRDLVHYVPRVVLPGVKSLVDDPGFFNAPDGRTDPQAELEATLARFFSTTPAKGEKQLPQCKFIARYHWLKERLQFDSARLPEQACPEFDQWYAALDPQSVTLVFPAAYLNNPASMFGHTLLRVDAKGQDKHTRLLAYAVNYAAATNETNGFMFAIRGLFGGYVGVFSVAPYYDKVNEYSDIENRDIWEYRLNFTPAEVRRMLEHTWELGHTWFRYYFFDENCSYNLLSLLEVARPSLKLTEQFRWYAIPSDTVRAVTEVPGLLKDVTYRPARSTQLRYRIEHTPVAQQYLAKDIATGEAKPEGARIKALADPDRAAVLDLAFDYLSYERVSGDLPQKPTAQRLLALLNARSRIDVDAPPLKVPTPAVRPDEGHKSALVAVGGGQRAEHGFMELRLRPAYHDLMDPEGGYVRGAQIRFLDLRARRYPDIDRNRIESFTALNITSLTPRNRLIKPLSWYLDVGWYHSRFAEGDEPVVFHLNGGAGLTYEPGHHALVYALLAGSLEKSERLRHHYALGAGPSIGAYLDPASGWRVGITAKAFRYGTGGRHSAGEVSLKQRITLGHQSALKLDISRHYEFGNYWTEGKLSLDWYY